MRNITQLVASLTLLATQVNVPQLGFGNVAAAATPSAAAAGVYEVKLNTTSSSPIEFVVPPTPNYNKDVLQPLAVAQANEAAAAKVAAEAAHAAALRARALQDAVAVAPVISGTHTDWMREAGIAAADYGYVDYIISHESGWGVTKSNRSGSGAYGLGQAFPASKMAVFGSDYLTDPITQLKWANAYAVARYGSWASAYRHWTQNHSW
jgi:hypothetical protein